MSRILANLILILIIAFTTSAVPINTELLNLNIQFPETTKQNTESEALPEETTPAEESSPTFTFTYLNNTFDYLYNPENIELKFVGSSSIETGLADLFINDLVLNVYKPSTDGDNQISKRIDNDDLSKLVTKQINGDVLTLDIDVSNTALNLANGHYTLSLIQNNSDLIETLDIQLDTSYFNEVTYSSPKNTASRGKRFITLYFTDEGKNYLVPVSREVRDSGNLIRTTLNELRDGPDKESGLHLTSPAPYVPAARFSTVTEQVSLETNSYENANFTQTDEDTYMMIHSLINTMTSIENIASVKFSVDKKDSTPLNGFDLKTSYKRPTSPKAYLGLQLENNKMYLEPVIVEATTATEMLKYLKYSIPNDNKLYTPVMPTIDVIDESISEGVLEIVFSDTLLTAYLNDATYGSLMMDSLLQSFNSLENVESIVIKTESNATGDVFGYPLGQEIEPAKYINVE